MLATCTMPPTTIAFLMLPHVQPSAIAFALEMFHSREISSAGCYENADERVIYDARASSKLPLILYRARRSMA